MPSKVAELRARLVELAKGMVVPQYPDNDPAADPALHLGAWTPWYLVKAKSDDELADSQLSGRADLYRTRHAPIITHGCGNCSGGSIMLSVLSFGARGDGVASNNPLVCAQTNVLLLSKQAGRCAASCGDQFETGASQVCTSALWSTASSLQYLVSPV